MADPNFLPEWMDTVLVELSGKGWSRVNPKLGGGGQAQVVEVCDSQGRRGALRYLNKRDRKSIARFQREVRVLTTEEYRHRCLVNILEHSTDLAAPWYISELGTQFKMWWRRRANEASSGEDLLWSALTVIRGLCGGLLPLHAHGLVHRDIKPSNLIVTEASLSLGEAVLIDFGIVYAEENTEERLTEIGEATGNLRFSPDIAAQQMDNPPAWLDVFAISQLLIWMLHSPPAKWQRPLHWRYVTYDPRLAERAVLGVRALTAACSDEDTSPTDAGGLEQLIDRLFVFSGPTSTGSPQTIVLRQSVANGVAARTIADAQRLARVNGWLPTAEIVFERLETPLRKLVDQLKADSVPVYVERSEFRQYADALRAGNFFGWLIFAVNANPGNRGFAVLLQALPSERFEPAVLPSVYVAVWELTRVSAPPFPFTATRFVFLDRSGQLWLGSENLSDLRATDESEIVSIAREWLLDEAVWDALAME